MEKYGWRGLLCLAAATAALIPVKAWGFTLNRNGSVAIVIPDQATPIERDAAQEMKEHLELAVKGCKASIAEESGAPAGGPVFYIGRTREAAKLGVKFDSLKPEEYVINVAGNRAVIFGADTPGIRPFEQVIPAEWGARGTANGVYDFLEQYCGVRWYFPGKDGRVIEEKAVLKVPDGQIRRKPYFGYRHLYSPGAGQFIGKPVSTDLKEMGISPAEIGRWEQRMRFGCEEYIPANHSVNHLRWVERFGKTHPEYFSLDSHGNRANSENPRKVEVCYTNPGVVDEYTRLAEDFFSGRKQLIPSYNPGIAIGNYFCIVPNDMYPDCYTPECRNACVLDSNGHVVNTSDLIFGFAKKVADRIKPEFPNAKISTAGYLTWQKPPSFELPDNLTVRLCVNGAWQYAIPERRQQELDLIAAWNKKSKGPLTLWNYQCDRATVAAMEPVMAVSPHCMSGYYKSVKPYIYGAMLENESFQWIPDHLDKYVFLKLMDNPDLDIDRLLDEYFNRFYGPAAKPMKLYFIMCEDIWTKKVLQATKCTPCEGGTNSMRVWSEVLTEPVVNEMKGYFVEAEKLAQAEPYKTRVSIVKKYMLGTTLKGYDNYRSVMAKVQDTTIVARLARDVKLDGKLDEPFWQKCTKQPMNPWRPETFGIPGAETGVQVAWDESNLYVGIDCTEPYTKNMILNVKTQDSNDIWKDSGVEVFLVPDMKSADQRYYQTLVNANGASTDVLWRTVSAEMMLKKVSDYTFNPGTKVATSKTNKGYSIEIAIPLDKVSPQKVVDDTVWKANFCRNRCLAGISGTGEVNQHYTWTPGLQGFHDIDAFGRLVFYKE